jgi:N-acetylmuramoyl-L-alanine amidase
VVTAKSGLNVRSGPSKKYTVAAVAASGSTVYVLGHKGNWYHVQLPNGVTGWVLGSLIGMGSTSSGSSQTARPVSPAKAGQPVASANRATTASRVTALNVHSSPSTNGAVVGSLPKGEKVVVLARRGSWVKVQLPDGSVGWVLGSYTTGGSAAHTGASSAASVKSTGVKSTAKRPTTGVAVNVRQRPSLKAGIVTTIAAGTSYTVLGWSNNWVHVRLSNGTTGWIAGSVIGALTSKSTTSSSRPASRVPTVKTRVSKTQYPHVVTASVRVHATPSLKGRVIGGATAGTRAQVYGYRNGFAHVNLSNGVSGYVYGTYVR